LREIVFDTETTGFYYDKGDRVIEIGAVELVDKKQTGKVFHKYINPEREVPEEAVKVHGLTYDFLKEFPTFDKIADEWLDFVGDAVLVAHNAAFDINFINYELKQISKDCFDFSKVVDSLEIARKKFPNKHNKLDDLCKRFDVDNSARTFHGALLDAQLLAEVYVKLVCGDEQNSLFEEVLEKKREFLAVSNDKKYLEPRNFIIDENIDEKHNKFLQENIKNALWNN
jgi:DNA polymerase-3 subunit epsilon